MKCRELKTYVYLKEDEISPSVWAEINKHLDNCSECSNEFSFITKTSEVIDKIRVYEPIIPDELHFADSVMNKIELLEKPAEITMLNKFINSFLDFFLLPSVRTAAVSVIIFIFSMYLFQQYFVFRNVSSLEKSIAIEHVSVPHESIAGFNNNKVISAAAELIDFVKGNRLYSDLSSDIIIADKSKINDLLSIYGDLLRYKNLYPDEIEKKYPELNSFLNQKLTLENMQDFLNKNKNMLNDISRKFPAGGNINEK